MDSCGIVYPKKPTGEAQSTAQLKNSDRQTLVVKLEPSDPVPVINQSLINDYSPVHWIDTGCPVHHSDPVFTSEDSAPQMPFYDGIVQGDLEYLTPESLGIPIQTSVSSSGIMDTSELNEVVSSYGGDVPRTGSFSTSSSIHGRIGEQANWRQRRKKSRINASTYVSPVTVLDELVEVKPPQFVNKSSKNGVCVQEKALMDLSSINAQPPGRLKSKMLGHFFYISDSLSSYSVSPSKYVEIDSLSANQIQLASNVCKSEPSLPFVNNESVQEIVVAEDLGILPAEVSSPVQSLGGQTITNSSQLYLGQRETTSPMEVSVSGNISPRKSQLVSQDTTVSDHEGLSEEPKDLDDLLNQSTSECHEEPSQVNTNIADPTESLSIVANCIAGEEPSIAETALEIHQMLDTLLCSVVTEASQQTRSKSKDKECDDQSVSLQFINPGTALTANTQLEEHSLDQSLQTVSKSDGSTLDSAQISTKSFSPTRLELDSSKINLRADTSQRTPNSNSTSTSSTSDCNPTSSKADSTQIGLMADITPRSPDSVSTSSTSYSNPISSKSGSASGSSESISSQSSYGSDSLVCLKPDIIPGQLNSEITREESLGSDSSQNSSTLDSTTVNPGPSTVSNTDITPASSNPSTIMNSDITTVSSGSDTIQTKSLRVCYVTPHEEDDCLSAFPLSSCDMSDYQAARGEGRVIFVTNRPGSQMESSPGTQMESSPGTRLVSSHTPLTVTHDHDCLSGSPAAHLSPQSTNMSGHTTSTLVTSVQPHEGGLVPYTESDDEFLYGSEPTERDGTASSLRLESPVSSSLRSEEIDLCNLSPLPNSLTEKMSKEETHQTMISPAGNASTGCDALLMFNIELELVEINGTDISLSDSPTRGLEKCSNGKTRLSQDLMPSESQGSKASVDEKLQDMVAVNMADSQQSGCSKQIEEYEDSQTSSEHASTQAGKTRSLVTFEEDLIDILRRDMFSLIASAHWAENPSQSSKLKRKATEMSNLSPPSKRHKKSVTEYETSVTGETITHKDCDINISKDVNSHKRIADRKTSHPLPNLLTHESHSNTSKGVSSVSLGQPTRPAISGPGEASSLLATQATRPAILDPDQTSSLLPTVISLPPTQTVQDNEWIELSDGDSEGIDVLTVSSDGECEQNSPVIINVDIQTDAEHDQDMEQTSEDVHFAIQHSVRVSDVQPGGTNRYLIHNTERDTDIIKGANSPLKNMPEMVLTRSSDEDVSQSAETSLILIGEPPVTNGNVRLSARSHSLNGGRKADNNLQENDKSHINGYSNFTTIAPIGDPVEQATTSETLAHNEDTISSVSNPNPNPVPSTLTITDSNVLHLTSLSVIPNPIRSSPVKDCLGNRTSPCPHVVHRADGTSPSPQRDYRVNESMPFLRQEHRAVVTKYPNKSGVTLAKKTVRKNLNLTKNATRAVREADRTGELTFGSPVHSQPAYQEGQKSHLEPSTQLSDSPGRLLLSTDQSEDTSMSQHPPSSRHRQSPLPYVHLSVPLKLSPHEPNTINTICNIAKAYISTIRIKERKDEP